MDISNIDPGDQVRLTDPEMYTDTKPDDIYTVMRLPHGFVEIKSPSGNYLTVEPRDLSQA